MHWVNSRHKTPPQTLTEGQRTRSPGLAEPQRSRRWCPGCWWRWVAQVRPSCFPPYQLQQEVDNGKVFLWETHTSDVVFQDLWTRTQQSAKGDGGRQSSEVNEDDSGEDLGIQCICDVTLVVLVASPDISNHPTKRSTSTGQGIFRRRSRGDGNWEIGKYIEKAFYLRLYSCCMAS